MKYPIVGDTIMHEGRHYTVIADVSERPPIHGEYGWHCNAEFSVYCDATNDYLIMDISVNQYDDDWDDNSEDWEIDGFIKSEEMDEGDNRRDY